jgi:dGTPase
MYWSQLLCQTRVQNLYVKAESTKTSDDQRTEFERDYDRAVFCTPVRRLQDKAQVFPLEPCDAIRTRLTHSLEVSTVARDIARQVARWLRQKDEVDQEQAEAIPVIAATCGLLHDLGNPPFGHAGEQAIASWFSGQDAKLLSDLSNPASLAKDFLLFEGNAQTIRIVSRLQVLAHHHGLNLTCGTMSALGKYTASSDQSNRKSLDQAKKKPGYFTSEEELINRIREITGTGDARNPITYLVEAADDIVYSTIDLEDGLKKKVVTWEDLEKGLEPDKDLSGMTAKCLAGARSYVSKSTVSLSPRVNAEALAQAFRNQVIGELVPAVVNRFKDVYSTVMEGKYQKALVEDCKASAVIKACKTVAQQRIYSSDDILRLEVMGREVIKDLMNLFWEGAEKYDHSGKTQAFDSKLYHLMSSNYRTVFEQALVDKKVPPKYAQLQLVTDYICGMTDTFACNLHKQLNNG